jgi:hypothetical protein
VTLPPDALTAINDALASINLCNALDLSGSTGLKPEGMHGRKSNT